MPVKSATTKAGEDVPNTILFNMLFVDVRIMCAHKILSGGLLIGTSVLRGDFGVIFDAFICCFTSLVVRFS